MMIGSINAFQDAHSYDLFCSSDKIWVQDNVAYVHYCFPFMVRFGRTLEGLLFTDVSSGLAFAVAVGCLVIGIVGGAVLARRRRV
jgi:hypothetical protein